MKTKIFKKPLAVFFSAMMLYSLPFNAFAETSKSVPADAKTKSVEVKAQTTPNIEVGSESVVLYDMNLNKVIYEKNPDKVAPTASLAKVMTMYLASESLKEGKVKNEDLVEISEKSWKTGGSRMFLEVGKQVPFGELLKGLAVVSGNDAAVSIAEHLDGTTEAFAQKMNEKAAQLGMKNTKFYTPNGLPEKDIADTSTARDLSLLTIDYLKKFPKNLDIHKMTEYEFDTGRGKIKQPNRNPLLGKYPGADGLKTGWVDGHYNLIATAQRGGVRLVAVIMTAPSVKVRESDAKKLLDFGFSQYRTVTIGKAGELVENLTVYKAKDVKETDVVLKNAIELVLHKQDEGTIREEVVLPEYLTGGLKKGDSVGKKNIYLGDKLIHSEDIIVQQDIPEAGFWAKFFGSIAIFFQWIANAVF